MSYRKAYEKISLSMEKMETVEKEPYDSSTDKAKELKIGYFGTPEEVREMARPVRDAHTFKDARKILAGLAGQPMTSCSRLTAVLSNNSIKNIERPGCGRFYQQGRPFAVCRQPWRKN
jgi:hypothetical protein